MPVTLKYVYSYRAERGFRVWGVGFGVQGLGFRVSDLRPHPSTSIAPPTSFTRDSVEVILLKAPL